MQRNISHKRAAGKFLKFTGSICGYSCIAVVLALAVFISSCAKRSKPSYKKVPDEKRRGEVMEPSRIPSADSVATPQRNASMQLVEKGKNLMDRGELDLAASSFRDAVKIDSTNGIAYYSLALVYFHLDRPELAIGFMDKADSLLSGDLRWQGKLSELRSVIEAGGLSDRHYDNHRPHYGDF
ncbi:MAG TPA: hypothetical protein PLT05_00460 [bacterium]|jgi:tetratricopeptide (TPR) repeat protein|nr:tetratricopeptide repeat protein [Myxococcales bacterium]HQC51169.1 hypothetical protein [bacterium]HQG12826.1 hypothetical protein [bacterium]HQH80898.1 hypothetical protein [bacterium]